MIKKIKKKSKDTATYILNAGGEPSFDPVKGPGFLDEVHLRRWKFELLAKRLIWNMAYYIKCCFVPLVHFFVICWLFMFFVCFVSSRSLIQVLSEMMCVKLNLLGDVWFDDQDV